MRTHHESRQHPLSVTTIAFRLLLIGFGIAGVVIMTVNSITSAKFFLIFSPIFMMYIQNHLVLSVFSSLQLNSKSIASSNILSS